MFLNMYSTNLQSTDNMAETTVGIRITLYKVQNRGTLLKSIRLLRIKRNRSMALVNKCYNISMEIRSVPEAIDLREKIAEFSSLSVNSKLKTRLGK